MKLICFVDLCLFILILKFFDRIRSNEYGIKVCIFFLYDVIIIFIENKVKLRF